MLLETVKSEGLAQLSYVVGDTGAGVCAVIDPRRDIERYVAIATEHQLRITHILETHTHADFISGARELGLATGAEICVGATGGYGFVHRPLHDGEQIELGELTLRVLHTPGHSPEHVCYVIAGGRGSEAPWGVFTGDTLFAGSVGRPDLATGEPKELLAEQLYDSLVSKLLPLGDDLLVLPGHGAGSPCGASIGERELTTLGYERRHSEKLQASSRREFVERVLADLPEEPTYYRRVKRANARGPEVIGPRWPLALVEPVQLLAEQPGSERVILDVRDADAFGGAHIEGALNIGLHGSFALWCGWMIEPQQRVVLVAERPEDAEAARLHLLRVGLERIDGMLRGGIDSWVEAGYPFRSTRQMSVHELHDAVCNGARQPLQVVDTRSDQEWASGHVPRARHMFTPQIEQRSGQLERDRPVALYCGTGYRASIAASRLEQIGFSRVYTVNGSMKSWTAARYPIER